MLILVVMVRTELFLHMEHLGHLVGKGGSALPDSGLGAHS